MYKKQKSERRSMTIIAINPATGQMIREYAQHTDSQIEIALQRTQTGYAHQKTTTRAERSEKMINLGNRLRANTNKYAMLLTEEMGKTFVSARLEILKCADLCDFYAKNTDAFIKPKIVQQGKSTIHFLPIGCILAIMPWNFPFWQVFRFAVPALMAGNVGLLKHASNVPGCALEIEKLFQAAGFTHYEFQTLLIGSDKIETIIKDDRIRAVTLTGSEGAGAAVAKTAGHALKKTVLELGGSDPFIIMPSANLGKVIDMAVKGRTQNNGQTCIAAKRFIIHAKIYDKVKSQMTEAFKHLNIGDPMEEGTDIGPLATAKIREELHRQVQESLKSGANLVYGCEIIEGQGHYYRPGILENIPPTSPAYSEELFGPVASLFKVDTLDEAITLANATRFGLGSVICSEDESEIDQAIKQLDAGATFINALVASTPDLPFGGVKSSGYGRELAANGMIEFMNIKTVVRG